MVDDGETGVIQAIRTHPEYRNMGIATKGKGHNFAAAKRDFPHMKRMRLAGFYGIYKAICDKNGSLRIIGERVGFFMYQSTLSRYI